MLRFALTTTVVILLTAMGIVRCDFTPGCSFVGGQCQYSVTLGHAGQCDSAVGGSSQIASGGAQCCEDMKTEVASLRSDVDLLRSQINKLTNNLAQSKDDLAQTQTTLDQTEAARDALLVTLRQKEAELGQTQADLADLFKRTGDEITALRSQLDIVTSQSDTCRAALGLPSVDTKASTPTAAAAINLRFCDFSSLTESPCKWTVEKSNMLRLMSASSSSQHGPQNDHTRGAGSSTFLGLDAQESATSAFSNGERFYTATSERFEPAESYCFFFFYNMLGKDVMTLRAYVQLASGTGYPAFERHGPQGPDWHLAQFELDSDYSGAAFSVSFSVSTTSHYDMFYQDMVDEFGDIGIDDLYAYNTSCDQITKCPRHSTHRNTINNVTSCYTFHAEARSWAEAYDTCRREGPWSALVSVESQEEQDYLVAVINADTALSLAGQSGFYTSGNDENKEGQFSWTNTGSSRPVSGLYENWHSNHNVGGVQDCLLLEYASEDYTWGDVDCTTAHPFICESYFPEGDE